MAWSRHLHLDFGTPSIYDVCLEVRGEIFRTVLFCVVLCTEAVHSHKHT